MAKYKYKFNPESLSFDRVKVSAKGLIIKIITYFFAGIAIAIAFNLTPLLDLTKGAFVFTQVLI